MARILVLNQYYSPDTTATAKYVSAIAERLAQEGHLVEAIVGQPSYSADAPDVPEREVTNGVAITRIALGRARGRERMSRRLTGYLRFMAGAAVAAPRRRADLVLCFHNPPPLILLGVLTARLRGARVVYVPQDIHPDILLSSGFLQLPRAAVRSWDAMNRFVLKRSDRTIALGDGMRETLVGKGAPPEQVATIPLWAEPELAVAPTDREYRAQLGLDTDLVVLYSGNMGVMHPLEPVLKAARELQAEPVSFLFVGGGVRRALWERKAAELELTNVTFMDFLPAEEFARLVAAADVGLVSLEPGMERLAVPSRGFAFLSAGLPVIAHMDPRADVARIVQDGGAGWHAWTVEELTALFRRLQADPAEVARAGGRARELFEQRFTRAAVTSRYAEVVSGLCGARDAA